MSAYRATFYQILTVAGILVILEVAARVAFTVYAGGSLHASDAPPSEWYVLTADLGWDRRPNFAGKDWCDQYRNFDSRGLVSADGAQLASSSSNQQRVVFIGDSNTYGYCVATNATFVEVAQRLLPNHVLVNLGVAGYTSFQGYKALLKYGEWIKPKYVFISFNYNDRRYVLSESDIDSDAAFAKSAAADRRNGRLESLYLYRLVKFVGAKIGVIRPSIESNSQLTVDKLKPRVSAESYRANLIKMVEWARAHGSLPYFILLGDNPNRSRLLERGKRHFEHGEYRQAIEDLELVTQYAHSTVAILARKYLSRAYAETKQSDKVIEAQALHDPFYSLTGGYPIVEDSVYNDIMRDVARQYSVPLIDAKSKLEQSPWVFFDDANHFDAEGHEIVGRLVGEALSR